MKDLFTEVKKMMDEVSLGEKAIADWLKHSQIIRSLQRLPGDASTRHYYRIQTSEQSYIVMQTEPFSKEGMSLPFLSVQKHLASAGVDVPAIYDRDPPRGFILLEDLGDITLLRKLQGVSNDDVERHLYEQAIDALIHLQIHASPRWRPAELAAYQLRFDREKLMWEVDFALEHFYRNYLKRNLQKADLKILTDGFGEICETLANQPTVLTHRDYHSRNIMVLTQKSRAKKPRLKERLVMIDFQDARLGPPHYDLASLLRDSYYQLEETQIQRLINYYIAKWEAESGDRLDQAQFRYLFDLMSVQRNFKAIGSFASFLNLRGNTTYLKYIGNTFENIRRTLLKYPQYEKLREVLFHYYYF